MNTIRIPGKVMLSGEYAVLHGGAAAMMPVSRFLTLTESADADEDSSPVVRLARDWPIERLPSGPAPGSFVVDRSEFLHAATGHKTTKLGLGSSAAEAVAVIAWRYQRAGLSWQDFRAEIATIADAVHRQAQGGHGSGADVALCAHGQPLLFHRADDAPVVAFVDSQLPLTQPLHLVWTGAGANTRVMMEIFERWRDGTGTQVKAKLDSLVTASRRLAGDWFGGDADQLLEHVDRHQAIMETISEGAGLPYFTQEHRKLAAWARGHGGRCKPTGAGGGDMALLIGDLPIAELDGLVLGVG
ncbi:MAG: hypothetical protein ABIE70_04335 [bacterium]